MAKGAPLRAGEEFDIRIPDFHEGQRLVYEASRAFLASRPAKQQIGKFFLVAHRGWRKSSFVLRKSLEHIRTGEPMGWYAPTLKTIHDCWANLWAKALGPENFERWINKSTNILSVPGCGQVFFWSLVDPSNAAGPTYPFIVGDEWGSLQDKAHAAVIDPILEKALVAYGHAEAWFVGTPNREGNPKNDFWFHINQALLPKSNKKADQDAVAWVIPLPGKIIGEELVFAPSPYANPAFDFERTQRGYNNARRKIGWRIEYFCEFINDEGGQFEKDAIEEQCSLQYIERLVPIPPPKGFEGAWDDRMFRTLLLPGHLPGQLNSWYQIGIDIGTVNDRVAIGVLDRNTMQQVYQHHFLPEGKHKWHMVFEAIAHVMKMYPGTTYVDITGTGGKEGSSVLENLSTYYNLRPEGVVFSGVNKPIMLDWTATLLEGGKLWLFDEPNLKFELDMMQRTAKASGGFTIAAPPGENSHDDLPIMVALMTKDVRPLQSASGTQYTSGKSFATTILDPIMQKAW